MIGIIVLFCLAFLCLRYTIAFIKPSFIRNYINNILLLFFIGSLSTIFFTIDNQIFFNQVDMPGDAQYYYSGALNLLNYGETQTYYPLYEYFISLFLYLGNPLLVRIAQLLLFSISYSFFVIILSDIDVTDEGLNYFSRFVVFNGIYYGTIVSTIRDGLLLFGISCFCFAFFKTQIHKKARYFFENPVYYFLLLISILIIYNLTNWVVYLLIICCVAELIITVFGNSQSNKLTKFIAILLIIAILLFMFTEWEKLNSLYMINVEEQQLLSAEGNSLGVEKTRSFFDIFKSILGPGLIRPLFPHIYFITWVPTHVMFYWLGTLIWYLNLIVSAPKVLSKPLLFVGKPMSVFTLSFFVLIIVIYTIAFGSGMGMRKRAVFHLFFSLFIALSYYTPTKFNHTNKLNTGLSKTMSKSLVILSILIANLASL